MRRQRHSHSESLLQELRNHAAHATGFQWLAPGDASSAIADLAEVINRLWGARTPGGRLYPAPIRRVAAVITWADSGNVTWSSAEYFRADPGDVSAADFHQSSHDHAAVIHHPGRRCKVSGLCLRVVLGRSLTFGR
jgi:hypothetical protein